VSEVTLQALIGTALVDRRFGEELLNGKRPMLVAEFDLTDEERKAILSVEAGSVQEFAVGLYERLAV
jgi:hypothetical protein